jgi:glyoxylase-like metal-dependent hydrolase (beta-lactamase superfamily II)
MFERFGRRGALLGAAATATALGLPQAALAQSAAPAATTAAPGFYRYKLGEFVVTMVHDGFRIGQLQGFVRNAPLEEVQKVAAESFLSTTQLRVPFTVPVIDTGRNLVVFDAGNGPQAQPGATIGQFAANLRTSGIDPARVTTVIHTHFHGDHIGGLINADGSAAFPNAEIVVPAAEWAWWTDGGNETRSPEGQRPTFANTARRFGPYQGKVRQIADGAEAVPGIRAVAAYGHTPGHTAYLVADGSDQLMLVGDLVNRPELIARRPDFHIIFDFDPIMAEAARRRLFDRVAADRVRLAGYHFPFPSTGFLAKEGNGYRFVPAEWQAAL